MNSEPYILEHTQWSQWGVVLWTVAVLASIAVFGTMLARRRRKLWPIVMGIAAIALLAGGFLVQSGKGAYTDDEGVWACPSGMNGVQIKESPDRPLPEGVAECRSDSRKNLTIGLSMAGVGVLITVAGAFGLRKESSEA